MNISEITAGAHAVEHLGRYIEELKLSAARMATEMGSIEMGTGERDHFTPSEDEAIRRILTSYCQARNALLEVIVSFRDDTELPTELRPQAFLVAYAAAMLLVDAARFLRELCQNSRLLRHKLNEPEPHLGIPGGTYDLVQKSLTNPRHAWHLFHAARFFQEHRDELSKFAADGPFRPAFEVIVRLGPRADVSASSYLKTHVRVRARRVLSRLRHGLYGRPLYGIQKLASSMAAEITTRPGHRPALPSAVMEQFRELLEPGDVLVVRKEHAITNYFLPGYWKHAALCLGRPEELAEMGIDEHENVRPRWSRLLSGEDQQSPRVLEAMKDGVRIRSLDSPFASDALVVLRPSVPRAVVAEALARGLFHEGKPYDFDFDLTRSDRLVCTEVIYRSFEGVGDMRFELTRRAGRLTISAMDLIGMALSDRHFRPLAIFCPGHGDEVVQGAAARQILSQTQDDDGCEL